MNSRVFWISLASVLVLIVSWRLGASLMISRFLRSEAFRKLMGAKTGEALYSEASYSPLSWSGPSMFVDSLQATGLEGSIVRKLARRPGAGGCQLAGDLPRSLESRPDSSRQL